MLIYYIQNKINNKVYIGQTTQELRTRKSQHLYDLRNDIHKNNYLQYTYNKYGESVFKFKVLEKDFKTIEELNDAEEFWITFLQTLMPLGYNVDAGGNNYKRPKYMSQITKEYFSVPVYQYDLDGKFIKEWHSITEAETHTEANNISNCVTLKQKTSGGYQWRYKSDNLIKLEPINPYARNRKLDRKRSKSVLQLNKKGDIIKEWDSVPLASETLNINRSNIYGCCTNRDHFLTAGGFKWRYKHE